ncbi:MAG: 30S ribosomal protein S3 [Clostridia bacterium]|nr:30S ribosomal protein S3 [Clostridia bacterium]
MGQKVSPIGMRIGINKPWDSTWFASKEDFAKFLKEDNDIRTFFNKKYSQGAISKVVIERTKERLVVNVYTGRPAVLIGVKGANVETIKKQLAKIVGPTKNLVVNIKEVKKVDLDAQLVAESVAQQLEKRVTFRRALKQAIQKVMRAGAKGCKVQVSGVVDGANTIARTEKYMEGSLPLQTIRADIDYGTTAAYTNYGKLGVKCWIYKGDILGKAEQTKEEKPDVNA